MLRRRRITAAVVGAVVASGLWLGAPLISSAVAIGVSAEDDEGGGGGGDPAPAEPAAPEPAPAESTPESAEPAEEPAEPDETPPSSEVTDTPEDATDPDATDEDGIDPDATDEDGIDPDATDEDGIDPDATDEDATDEDGIDPDATDEDATDEDAQDGAELTEDEGAVEEMDSDGPALSLDIAQGDGVEVSARGAGLLAESRAELWVFSTPQLLAQGTADASGEIVLSATLPGDLAAGSHTVVLKGTDPSGQPVEFGSSVEIGPNGELLGVTPDADLSGLVFPELPDNPKAPQYPKVEALDQPAAVVSATIAAVALLSVAGAGLAGAGRAPSPAGGGINEGLYWAASLLDEIDVEHNRGWRTRFRAMGRARGDRSWLHRSPLTAFVDEASFLWPTAVSAKSPLLARIMGDAAPLRAIFGSASLLLPLAALVLGVVSAVTSDGIAQPPVLGLLIALIVIGVLDAFAGLVGTLAFSVVVVAMGGIVDLSSVRTLMGVALLIIGPGLIATSFREIRRAAPHNFAQWWERGADIIIVPLLGAYTTYNVASSLPPLGGSLFPVGESSVQLAWIVAGLLVVKVCVEEAAARWFPERLATVVGVLDDPGTTQQVLSAMLKLSVFLFISAAFIGTSWHLWVGALVWFLPTVLAFLSWKLPNSSRLWQAIPRAMPLLAFSLFVFLILASITESALGDTPDFALTSFVIVLIPGLLMAILAMFGREPVEGDVRWYLRPSMTTVYRVGGVLILVATIWLAVDSIF